MNSNKNNPYGALIKKVVFFCRKNGYFPHPDPKVCDVFHFCVDGVPNPVNCPRLDMEQ
jgi:hypothetical protein